MSVQSTHIIFAQCAPGLEELLCEEVRPLVGEARVLEGGVEFRGTTEDLWKLCLGSRLAESVRLRLKSFQARQFSDLSKELKKLPFRAFLPPGSACRVQVVCHKSRLWHSGAVQQRLEEVLVQHVGWVLSEQEDAQLVHLRFNEDEAQVSLDAGGPRMHRRGYRPHVEKASLRETLAAALLFQTLRERPSGTEAVSLWDPFCGAGTILLEGIDASRGLWAGRNRAHAFESWRSHVPEEFAVRRSAEGESPRFWTDLKCIGSDREERAIAAATSNALSAGFDDQVKWIVGDVRACARQIPEGAMVVTNPPYGKRLAEVEGVQGLLEVLKERPDLTPVLALVGGVARDVLPKASRALFRTKNGGLSVSARRLRP